IKQKTSVADYALIVRGDALLKSGRTAEAQTVFETLIRDYSESLKIREAKLGLAAIRKSSNETERVVSVLQDLIDKNDGAALLITAQTYEQANNQPKAIEFYRKVYFYAAVSNEQTEAENSLKRLGANVNQPSNAESITRAESFFRAKKYSEAAKNYQTASQLTSQNRLNYGIALSGAKRYAEATTAFNAIPISDNLKEQAYLEAAKNYANARQSSFARQSLDDLRRNFPKSEIAPKAFIAVGNIFNEQKNKLDADYFYRTALASYPNAVEVGQAQFGIAWNAHETRDFQTSSQQLIEHLARYAAKDTTFRGRAGYWAARDSERAGKIGDACALYNGMFARYDANWYGYLAKQRLDALNANRQCQSNQTQNPLVSQAVAALKTVTVAPETSTEREQQKITKADELSSVALFDWAIDELNEAAKTAANSPKINLGVAKLYRRRGDNVNALLALARSYPDYSQMKPEELSREEWDIFYPLNYWETIKLWAKTRTLDPYQVAGLIRQESVFNPRAKSGANAFGLMQMLVPTAKATARKYGNSSNVTAESLYNPQLNIELGTGFMRQQFDNYGRIEYVAAAYNAGPGRVVTWRQTLPLEMDEWAEAIPFKETKGYVQGVVRNTAQYRRLYDENGNFKSNVGTKPLRGFIDTLNRDEMAKTLPEIIVQEEKNDIGE
ncbi:MAG: transglycosylase SLT domain-containing protein, partial [Pyrinomonadaceae bacterium]|nr:transglycosylase SLT domain-containing protein [Pyrinomonadaceae bacterium]